MRQWGRSLTPLSNTNKRERLLALLLRISAVVLCLAFGAVFLPNDWMAATHEWLGLGTFPASLIVEYLARSISALYGIYGILCFVVATDVRRYLPVIVALSWSSVGFGMAIWVIDLKIGVPWHWTLFEGPPILILAVVFLAIARRIRREATP
jgi:hypothetical protein